MKTRKFFISNSSSSSFLVTNTSDEPKTLVDFAEETKYLVKLFNIEYSHADVSLETFLINAKIRYAEDFSEDTYEFAPHETKTMVFGDEDGES